MKKKNHIQNILEIFIFLLLINYMFITVILHDNFAVKYLRDFFLIILFGYLIFSRKKIRFSNETIFAIIFLFIGLISVFKATTVSTGINCFRRYLFPLVLLFIVSNIKTVSNFNKFNKFLFVLMTILCLWGIIQADILGDIILRKLGYPVTYSYGYKRDMLYNSYYFGGLGIQRVVSTLSSSNIFALITGMFLIYFIFNYKYINVKHRDICLVIIIAAYILSFSRANFLAMLIILLLWLRKFIPHKRKVRFFILFLIIAISIYGIIQGNNGLIAKLLNWVKLSFTFKEDSAAGRTGIWFDAFKAVLRHPFGMGYGHSGGMGDQNIPNNIIYPAENSYLTIALDTGWLGLIMYLLFLLNLLHRFWKNSTRFKHLENDLGYRINKCAFIILSYLMIAMFFSNHIQDMETVCIAFLFAGLAIYFDREKSIV